ncbi:hypothetical protein EPO05_01770 [Patescibacteria group bacterium]|nr:MAG: hypothetical protein EPO05_01770 [Patescibacteria group bacterium]
MSHKLTPDEQLATIRSVQTYLAAIKTVAASQTGLEKLRLLTGSERLKCQVITPLNKVSRLRPSGNRVGEALRRVEDLVGASSGDVRRIISSPQFAQAINLLADATSCRPDPEEVSSLIHEIHEVG